jgi:hypothetical protein
MEQSRRAQIDCPSAYLLVSTGQQVGVVCQLRQRSRGEPDSFLSQSPAVSSHRAAHVGDQHPCRNASCLQRGAFSRHRYTCNYAFFKLFHHFLYVFRRMPWIHKRIRKCRFRLIIMGTDSQGFSLFRSTARATSTLPRPARRRVSRNWWSCRRF